MELYNYYPCHSLITNLGRIKYTFIDGKEYIVAPMTTIVPGVLNGSKGALYYPPDEIKRNVREWDNIPITVYHPDVAGRHASASEPGVMERQGIGFLAKSEYKGKLVHEGYFDIERTKIVDNRILEALETGQAIELSTGLFTENEPAIPGANYNGKGYDYIARNYKPDHLAILPDQIGACSILDGCGVLVNSFFVDHLESSKMEIETTDNTDTTSIHGNGTVDIDLATDLREGSSKGSINNSTVPYINGDSSTHSILHRMFEWLVSNSGISRVDVAVNSNPEGINQYTKGGATSEAAKASSKLSGSAKGKEALGLAQRAMASSGSGNSEKAAARHTEAAAAHREAAKAGGKDSDSHLQAAALHDKAAEVHRTPTTSPKPASTPTPRTAVPATKPSSVASPSPKSTSTPTTVTPPATKAKGTLTSAHVVQAIKDVHKGGLADMADVREHELLKEHSKEHQDEAIAKARSEGKVSGSSYEGRHGVSERQKAAVHVDKWGEKIGGLAVRNQELLVDTLNTNPEGCNQYTQGECSGAGDGSHLSGKEAKRYASEKSANSTATTEAMAFDNRVHGHQIHTTDRPDDERFHDEHRKAVEQDVEHLLSAGGNRPVAKTYWLSHKTGTAGTHFWVDGEKKAEVFGSSKEGGVRINTNRIPLSEKDIKPPKYYPRSVSHELNPDDRKTRIADLLRIRPKATSKIENQSIGQGNWSLPKRSEHAKSLTESADQASSDIDDDSTKEDHLSAFQAHKEAADAHRMAAREAATGSSRGGEKDFAASGYHANKAAYHADKADQHGKECGMVENSNPEGINQYTNGGVGTVADRIEHAVSSAKGRKELASSMKGIAKETNASIRDAAKGAVRGVHAEDLGSHPGHVRSAIKSILAQHSTDFANDLIGHVNHETSYTHKQLKGGESKSQIQAVIGSAREELGSKGVKDKFDFNAGYMHKDLVSALKSHGHTHESAHQEASRIIGRLGHRLGIESHTSNVDNTDTYDTSSPPSFTPSIPTIKSGRREKKLKPGKASAYGSSEAKAKIEEREDRFKPVVPAPPVSQKLTPPSSTEPLPSSNANPISRDSEGQFTSKDKDKRATSSASKGSDSDSKSSGFGDPEDDNPEEGDEEKVARLRGVGAYNANPEGINQYSKMGKLTAESKIRVGASKIGTSKKALAGTNKVSEGSITHEAAAGLHDKAAEYHTTMGNSDIADAHKYLAGYHRSKSSSTENQAMRITYEDILTNQELGDSSRFASNDERLSAFKDMLHIYNEFSKGEPRRAFQDLLAANYNPHHDQQGRFTDEASSTTGKVVQSHTGRGGVQSHTGREGTQSHTEREGAQSHTGRGGNESHTGREGTQSHTGKAGPSSKEKEDHERAQDEFADAFGKQLDKEHAEKHGDELSHAIKEQGSKEKEELSGKAAGASKLARKQGKRDTGKYGRAHARAASAHAQAASAHAASGDAAMAAKHNKAGEEHAAIAKKHGQGHHNPFTYNQDNPFVGEYDMTREADITWLATNCDCWKGPGDLETLNMLSDDKLATLKDVARHSLAEKYALRRGLKVGKKHYTWNAATGRFDTKKVVKAGVEYAGGDDTEDEYNVNADDEDYDSDEEDDMDEDDEDVAKRFRGMKDTRNRATMNMQQWESSMPPEARRVWNLAKSVEANTRNTLIQQLIANVYGDKERQLLYNTLKDKSMQELQVLANLVPPSVGYGTPDFIPQSYVGASVPAHNRATTNDSESDILPLPTINFSEWAKGNSGS